MAFPVPPQNPQPLLNLLSSSSSSFSFTSLKPHTYFAVTFKPCNSLKNTTSSAQSETKQTQLVRTEIEVQIKKKRKPKPSFYEQIRDKWSLKPVSHTKKFPWQNQQEEEEEEEEESPSLLGVTLQNMVSDPVAESYESYGQLVGESKTEEPIFGSDRKVDRTVSISVSDPDSSNVESLNLYGELVGKNEIKEPIFDSERNFVRTVSNSVSDTESSNVESLKLYGELVGKSEIKEPIFDSERNTDQKLSNSDLGDGLVSGSFDEDDKESDTQLGYGTKFDLNLGGKGKYDGLGTDLAFGNLSIGKDVKSKGSVERLLVEKVALLNSNSEVHSGASMSVELDNVESKGNEASVEGFAQQRDANRLPWTPRNDFDKRERERQRTSKTELAEKTVPEHELKRLRNVALRMKERIKVGEAGITQALVDKIHDKWKIDEVVKLRFEGPPSKNMKRTHEFLESKTGGFVIWRAGSSVVLYRGLTYKLGCVQTYVREKGDSDVLNDPENSVRHSFRSPKHLSDKELTEMAELNNILEDLGPRYLDWSGHPPLPVDADLLPAIVPGYKTPFRRLPHGVRRSLKDEETTQFRRLARTMPPHFALGRSRELQGLARAMVKLWQKSAIAKIAIKRGVLNTNNERMAEQLKKLTGGTLLSRNKEYIVFYRGNDFLPPSVTEALKERESLAMLQYQEEEARRYASALINSSSKKNNTPMVAGTLSETVAATSRWGKQPSSEDVERMLKDSAMARHASLVKYLEKKLAWAKGKMKKAEKALAKVQESLVPEDLPTDLETITDEERLVFRKMGLSMKPHLILGRRAVFDGTIENMHLHWKFREVVKIIVKGKSFPQVKHIAISLEAESGGLLVSIDKTTKGYAIIVYRGKNYQRPLQLRPRNLLTRRQALARSIELQRREGLKHHISNLMEQIDLLKSGLEDMNDGKEINAKTFYEKLGESFIASDDETEEDEDDDEEAYLQIYDSEDENGAG